MKNESNDSIVDALKTENFLEFIGGVRQKALNLLQSLLLPSILVSVANFSPNSLKKTIGLTEQRSYWCL
jgi:hypothetical protein